MDDITSFYVSDLSYKQKQLLQKLLEYPQVMTFGMMVAVMRLKKDQLNSSLPEPHVP